MTVEKDQIARHIPYLRRYARALFGSQDRGDQYVRVCLETLLAEPQRIAPDQPLRAELYRLFHDVHERVARQIDGQTRGHASSDSALETEVLALPPKERQILLLTAIEEFSFEDAGRILGMEPADAERLLHQARDDLTKQTATTVLIVEDEAVVAFDIAGIVQEMGHKVVGTAATKRDAISLARDKRPGIVLADIQLGDGSSGIDAASEILDAMDVPIIFITAYPERLLTGEVREPTFLVTKPFESDTLKVTIYQALLAHKKSRALGAAR